MIGIIALELFHLFVLSIPLIWELTDDAHGDSNKKTDVIFRGAYMALAAGTVANFSQHSFGGSLLLSLAIHFLIFDYGVAYFLKRNGIIVQDANIFSYLGKSAWMDMLKPWKKAGPWQRFLIRLGVLALAIILYM